MKSIKINETISFNNVISKSFKATQDEIVLQIKAFYDCIKQKGINLYPQIAVNHSLPKEGDNIIESEIFVICNRDLLENIKQIENFHEEKRWDNVIILDFYGTVSEFQLVATEFLNYIKDNDIRLKSGFYNYISEELIGNDVYSKSLSMKCFAQMI